MNLELLSLQVQDTVQGHALLGIVVSLESHVAWSYFSDVFVLLDLDHYE